jgi:hypothetical protein
LAAIVDYLSCQSSTNPDGIPFHQSAFLSDPQFSRFLCIIGEIQVVSSRDTESVPLIASFWKHLEDSAVKEQFKEARTQVRSRKAVVFDQHDVAHLQTRDSDDLDWEWDELGGA